MKGFNFEKNLQHQTQAVESTLAVFNHLEIQKSSGVNKNFINPVFNHKTGMRYSENLRLIQGHNGIKELPSGQSNILDIMMETGTGKTYTYVKTIFEMNKHFGIFKFIVVVPTLSIKAGAIDFIKSDTSRQHFKEQYGKTIRLHKVESIKGSQKRKSNMPPAVSSFVSSGDFEHSKIQVMIINTGMINSDTMQKSYDKGLFDEYTVPFKGISAVKPFVIIDEPHKFSQVNKTWGNIQKMGPQFILRYGATFQEYENLIYTLSAVDSFNNNLVKGVIGHITEFESGKNALVRLINTDGKEATFELIENGKKQRVKLSRKESLQKVHSEMIDLIIENLSKSKVELSNGLEMKKGDKINPYSYAQTVQETMIQKAVKNHFLIEKALLTRDVKIKPLTLFFIDNIEEYRKEDGYIKKTLERLVEAEIRHLLKDEKNLFYRSYLEKSLKAISRTHGGYFAVDKKGKDSNKEDDISQQVDEILHNKQAMLDLGNPRRFIFSKWTLREGWDNPNVFQICKLRSSGSEISKLQEVGRGLRLPVNEYGNRVKDEQFFLNYFVDFTESDFIDHLVNEINYKSGAISAEEVPEKLSGEMIKKICDLYETSEDELLDLLDQDNVVTRTNKFKEGGFIYIKNKYPLIFQGVGSNKIRKSTESNKRLKIRTEKYQDLKELWEKLNEKVILEYKFHEESQFKKLLTEFFIEQKANFSVEGIRERRSKIEIKDDQAISSDEISILDEDITPISTMDYSEFLLELAGSTNLNIKTIHEALIASEIEINKYLNNSTVRLIKQNFNNFLMYNAVDKFSIEYMKVSNTIHPTKITNSEGEVLKEISASDVGVKYSDLPVNKDYFFDELYYDSELEKENIESPIEEVVVFTKIPKNSIKIPVAGGKSYSPDFAYVLHLNNGEKKLHFIIETKDVSGKDRLRDEEKQKIKHAEKFFGGNVKINFKTQFSTQKIVDLIKEITVKP
ncbi:type III restriction-modification system endonuclease [Salinimicrobium tongyeongense]|uniref:Type III restriction-modification system endonuclease n=1 Tax=Salinimicrobium tongyeongense TaxID=2809707 RepID=A0ABY6NUI7_9FLAO|nr:type III restriction-modification system endonuclease [Salinimicrobium tongyeongense]UZH56321.1 type III restriction-modification system endonuclease [Salinimicrobium tongyeongense]